MPVGAETDLYFPVKRFLEEQGYAVRAEVRDCDVVAVRGEAVVVVELKRAFGLPLVYQGLRRRQAVEDVYLGVPEPEGRAGKAAWRRSRKDAVQLCRLLGLGLLVVTGGRVTVLADPAPYRPRRDRKARHLLLGEFAARSGDFNAGGSTRRPVVTAYREDALRCADALARHGALKVGELRRRTGIDRTGAILLRNVYGWFERAQRGVYGLTPAGRAALDRFAPVVEALRANAQTSISA